MAVGAEVLRALLGDEPKPAPGALALVQAFVNTRDEENGRESLGSPAELRAWLSRAGYGDERVGARELARVLAVREAIRELLIAHTDGADPDPAALAAIDAAAAELSVGVAVGDRALRLRGRGRAADRLLGDVLVAAHDADVAGNWPRLKACADAGCRWVFYDASRNRGGAWCDMRICGNRNKDRRFRARRRGGGSP